MTTPKCTVLPNLPPDGLLTRPNTSKLRRIGCIWRRISGKTSSSREYCALRLMHRPRRKTEQKKWDMISYKKLNIEIIFICFLNLKTLNQNSGRPSFSKFIVGNSRRSGMVLCAFCRRRYAAQVDFLICIKFWCICKARAVVPAIVVPMTLNTIPLELARPLV